VSSGGARFDPDACGGNAAPYVLGALSPEESEAFRRHLASCAICREEVAALAVVAAALPAAAPQLTAPPALKQRVMSAVHEDARVQDATRSSRSRRRRAPRVVRIRPAMAGLAAVAVLIALLAFVFAPGDGEVRVVRAQVLAPRATALVRVRDGHAELRIAGMPQPGPGRVYEVWIKGVGRPRPTDALFGVSSRGEASVGVPGGVAGVREILVTSEPRGGSRVPTRAPVIIARVS
jgi:anti-sigma-K factor RskA